jgi:hypothetical protein
VAKGKTNEDVPVEVILMGHTPEVCALAEQLRVLIRTTVPDAVERAYPGWRGIGYTHPVSGYFGAIFPQETGVKLGFEFGVLLTDPDGLLTGTGRQLRYVDLPVGADVPVDALVRLLREVVELPPKRSVKLSMIENASPLPHRRRAKPAI